MSYIIKGGELSIFNSKYVFGISLGLSTSKKENCCPVNDHWVLGYAYKTSEENKWDHDMEN